jgi:GT2 family glycosyltransferase
VGEIDPKLFHNWADADYALRIKTARIPSYLVTDAICDNDHNRNPSLGSWTESDVPFSSVLKGMRSPASLLYWPSRRHFFRKHWGLFGYVPAIMPYIRFFAIWMASLLIGRSGLHKARSWYRRCGPGSAK